MPQFGLRAHWNALVVATCMPLQPAHGGCLSLESVPMGALGLVACIGHGLEDDSLHASAMARGTGREPSNYSGRVPLLL